ncbi:MAG: hypothetical protein ACK46Q_10945 [Hyphomonas sp.]
MRLPLIALIPAALIAGAAFAQEDVLPADPATSEIVETEAEPQEVAPPAEVQTTQAIGSWERTGGNGRETVSYTSEEGETLFSATCMVADTEYGDRVIELKAAASDDAGAIDIFTSAGNARVPAAADTAPETAAGLTETVGQPTYVLAAGAGEMRIVSGTRGIVFETDPMLRDLLRGCRSEQRAVVTPVTDADEEADSEPAEDTDTSS